MLRVELYDKTGRNFITRLPVTFSANNLDPFGDVGPYSHGRGHKLVLCVLEQDKPAWQEYADPALPNGTGAAGLMEDVLFMPVGTRDLPDSVLGYEMVDSVLWLDANARTSPSSAASGWRRCSSTSTKAANWSSVQPPDRGPLREDPAAGRHAAGRRDVGQGPLGDRAQIVARPVAADRFGADAHVGHADWFANVG